ncbi:Odorant receptor 419, partial [Nylanderia fulva]
MKIDNTLSKSMEIVLRIFGIWPNSSYILFRISMDRYTFLFCRVFRSDENLSETMAYTIFLIKLGTFWNMYQNITMMATDFENRIIDEVSMITTTYYANLSRRLNNGTIVILTVAILLNCSNISRMTRKRPILPRTAHFGNGLPFDFNQTLVYWLIIIIQFSLNIVYLCAWHVNTLLINL